MLAFNLVKFLRCQNIIAERQFFMRTIVNLLDRAFDILPFNTDTAARRHAQRRQHAE